MRQLLYNSQHKRYYLFEEAEWLNCDICNKELESPFIHLRQSKGQNLKDFVFCSINCAKKNKSFLSHVGEVKNVYFTNVFIDGSILVSTRPVELGNGEVNTVFEAALNKNEGVKIINKCKVAFDPNRNIQELENKELEAPAINWANAKRKKNNSLKGGCE